MFHKSQPIALLALTLILLAGCGAESPATSPLPTPAPPTVEPAASSPSPSTGEVQLLRDVVANPGQYAGGQITVEGVLEEEGEMPRVRFFLHDGEDRLETSSWAPLETILPPQGGAAAKSMAYYVHKHLRLTGVLEEGGEGLLLQVSGAEELP